MLVTTEWLAGHLEDPDLVVAESDEDVLLYETGHIPGAVKLDWHTELNDPVTRDYVDRADCARLMSEKEITPDTTLVLYGDRNNWWAAYALWVCTLFGHADLRLLDGGRAKWIAESRPLTTEAPQRPRTGYPVAERDDTRFRAFRDQVLAHLGEPLIDVRSPGEYTGELLHMPDYPQEGALRGGHISPAPSVPSPRAAAPGGRGCPRRHCSPVLRRAAGGADHPRLGRHSLRRAGWAGRGRNPDDARRVLQPARVAGPGEPAAAARHGGDAGPDQASGARATGTDNSCR